MYLVNASRLPYLLMSALTLFVLATTAIFSPAAEASDKRLQVGIALHPYYSYVAEIVGDRADILPLVESGFNPHSYELQPSDLNRLMKMDALVLNGIGHDGFAVHAVEKLVSSQPALAAKLTLIYANKAVPLPDAPNTRNA